MAKLNSRNEAPAGPRQRTEGGVPAGPPEDACRCKEVSKKTPAELLRLMLSDLAFWKRKK